jgi:hypothetical protein
VTKVDQSAGHDVGMGQCWNGHLRWCGLSIIYHIAKHVFRGLYGAMLS